jgi:hypothetical protein
MAQAYAELITEVCELIGFKEAPRLIAGEPIIINDVMFSLIHEEHIDPKRIFLFAGFGEIPGEKRLAILEELLRQNHAGFNGEGPGFTISPTTGKVAYSLHLFLDTITAAELAAKMIYLAEIAHEWRKTHFLDMPASTSSAARRPHFIQPSA